MKWRFRRTLSIFPGLRLNFGKKGMSLSVGPRGAKVTVGKRGVRGTVGVPGTGVSMTGHRPWSKDTTPEVGPVPSRRLIDNHGPYWEFVLVAEELDAQIDELNARWHESIGPTVHFSSFCYWASDHMSRLTALVRELIHLLETDLEIAIGPPGTSGDKEKIIALVDSVADVMKRAAQWEQVVRLMAEHPLYGKLAGTMSGGSKAVLDILNEFRDQHNRQLAQLAETHSYQIVVNKAVFPNINEVFKKLEQFNARAVTEQALLGDFYQIRFIVRRGQTELGEFSRSAVVENLGAGLFQPDDMYWSEKQLAWRSLSVLETEVNLKIPDLPTESPDK